MQILLKKGIFFELVSNPVFHRFIAMTDNSQSPIKLLDCSERHTIRHESDYFRIELGIAKLIGAIILIVPKIPVRVKHISLFGTDAMSCVATTQCIPRSLNKQRREWQTG